mmetsp:Transcript_53183/g.88157  ORF Transcript_53183/g.88157 Transcript_53183/m.88157 type:complete len:214 (+) Transcript_53183:375-1016(+)
MLFFQRSNLCFSARNEHCMEKHFNILLELHQLLIALQRGKHVIQGIVGGGGEIFVEQRGEHCVHKQHILRRRLHNVQSFEHHQIERSQMQHIGQQFGQIDDITRRHLIKLGKLIPARAMQRELPSAVCLDEFTQQQRIIRIVQRLAQAQQQHNADDLSVLAIAHVELHQFLIRVHIVVAVHHHTENGSANRCVHVELLAHRQQLVGKRVCSVR